MWGTKHLFLFGGNLLPQTPDGVKVDGAVFVPLSIISTLGLAQMFGYNGYALIDQPDSTWKLMENSPVAPQLQPGDSLDAALRIKRLDELQGQDKVRNNLEILIEAAQKREESLDHVMLYGPPVVMHL